MSSLVIQRTGDGFWQMLDKEEESKLPNVIEVQVKRQKTGSMNMLALWRSWMKSTADYMAQRGCTVPAFGSLGGDTVRPFNAEDAHAGFTAFYMGTDDHGNRYSWKMKVGAGERVASKGQRLHAMERHQAFMVSKGIRHINPEDSEFRRLQAEQEK